MELQKNIILAPLTTYRIGGPADLFFEPHTREELRYAVMYAVERGIPYFVLGTGANILISDEGFRGLVIRNGHDTFAFETYSSTETKKLHWLRTGSGAVVGDLINASLGKGWSGLEHYAGIPSTVGGALWQNLHFLNPERTGTVFISEVLDHAYVLNVQTGNVTLFRNEDFKFGYDTSVLHQGKHVVLEAVFRLEPEHREVIQKRHDANRQWRDERHPPFTVEFSCGSVFKKAFADGKELGAGRLIEGVGLKGYAYHGATISRQHANFITHTGGARAADIMHIIRHAQKLVLEKKGILLETEIRFIGDFNE